MQKEGLGEMELPSHLIWILWDREASGDDGLHVSSGVEALLRWE